MDEDRADVKGDRASFTDERDAAPRSRTRQTERAARGIAGAVDRNLEPLAVAAVPEGVAQLVRLSLHYLDREPAGDRAPPGRGLDADDLRPKPSGDHRGTDPHGAEAGDQDAVRAADAEAQTRGVGGAEPARHDRPIEEAELIGQGHERALLCQEVRRVAAVALPAVCGARRAAARDHPARAAVVAQATTGDVVDGDAVTDLEPEGSRADGLHDAGGLVARDHAAVCLRAAPLLGRPVNGSQIATADGRRLHAHEHLSRSGLGHRDVPDLDAPVARQEDAAHGGHAASPPSSRRYRRLVRLPSGSSCPRAAAWARRP